MLQGYLSLTSLHLPLNHFPYTFFRPHFSVSAEYGFLQSNVTPLNNQMSRSKTMFPSASLVPSFSRLHNHGALPVFPKSEETVHVVDKVRTESGQEIVLNEESQLDSYHKSKSSHKDVQRSIGQANKGRVPWNKGRKHSAETRELIKRRTIEALKDPKVKKKMSESPHVHSVQSKARIQFSLRRVWAERLERKHSRERFYSSWAESIAMAAKKGGTDEQELEWDSYDRLKQVIAVQHLQSAADRVKAKKMKKQRADMAAKAEKRLRLAQRGKNQEHNATAKVETNRKMPKKSKEGAEELAVMQGLKLKARLTKIQKKKPPVNSHICRQGKTVVQSLPASEKLHLESIKRVNMRREVSLADQIRAAKSQRAEMGAGVSPLTSYTR